MKTEVLKALIEKWQREAVEPEVEVEDGAPEMEILNAIRKGRRNGYREAAEDLHNLITLLG